ncbi:MAG: PRC-barrel domain-containing protein [Anaerolineae bacterium]|nr:PRC-barrel domain-containing protein [Anaerolineae bacterium]
MKNHNPRVLSASSINGDDVKNPQGEHLGHIEDLMVDLNNGRISYAVLSFGGFLGMGDKLFAIPMEALTLDAENKEFILNVSEEKLENAPGFDKDNWPDMADRQFATDIYNYYEFKPYWN